MKISRMAGVEISWLYMYSLNDSVLFYAGNGFHLLYDFGAITGDTITLGYYTTYDGSPLKMVIDSTGTMIINGETRKLQYVSCGDGMVIEFGGIVIEGIGNIGYMFSSFDPSLDGPLRCYEDSVIGLFINPYHSNNGWNFQDCEQVITGMSEPGLKTHMKIFPNPASNILHIEIPEQLKTGNQNPSFNLSTVFHRWHLVHLEIYNLFGKKMLSKEVVESEMEVAVDVSLWPCGMYVVRLVYNGQIVGSEKVMVE
jgi:hypothetical protein